MPSASAEVLLALCPAQGPAYSRQLHETTVEIKPSHCPCNFFRSSRQECCCVCCDGAALCALVTMIMLKDSKQDQEKLCSLGPPAARCKLLHPSGLPVSIFSLSLSLPLSPLGPLGGYQTGGNAKSWQARPANKSFFQGLTIASGFRLHMALTPVTHIAVASWTTKLY